MKKLFFSMIAAPGQKKRWMALGGVGVVAVGVVMGWLSWLEWLETQTRQVEEKSTTLAWMRQVAGEVAQLKKNGARGALTTAGGDSLLALADRSVKARGLGSTLQRVEPESGGRVRLWFEKVPFDGMMAWLTELANQHAVGIDTITIDKEESSGLVRARMVLSWPERSGNPGGEKG